MAVQLSQLSTITTTATALSNLILVSPQNTVGYQPQNPYSNNGTPNAQVKPPALLFHYEGEQTATLESDITDHYVEDNSAVQDQIALKPVIVTTHGFIGELNDVVPVGLQTLNQIANKLTTISSYTPALSVTALIAYNTAFQLYQTAVNLKASAVSSYNNLAGGGGENVLDAGNDDDTFDFQTGQIDNDQNKQQVAFQQFYGYWAARTLFTVQTPWAVFEDMAIMRLHAVQDAETNVITDFELSFKQIRSASTLTTNQNNISYAGRLQQQGASPTSIGAQTPTTGGPSVGDGLTQIGVA